MDKKMHTCKSCLFQVDKTGSTKSMDSRSTVGMKGAATCNDAPVVWCVGNPMKTRPASSGANTPSGRRKRRRVRLVTERSNFSTLELALSTRSILQELFAASSVDHSKQDQ